MAFPAFQAFLFIASLLYSHFSANQARREAKQRQRQLDKLNNRGHLVNSKSTDFVYPLIYGPCRVGGNKVYEATSGSGDQYYHMILNLGMGPLHGIYREDGSIYEATGSQIPAENPPLIYLDGVLWTETNMAANCYFEWFDGASDQSICATLAAAVPQWNLLQRHKAYLYCRFLYDRDKFLSVPEVTIKAAGLECVDPSTGATDYTTNFALHAYDMLTRPRVLGGLGIGTLGSEESELFTADGTLLKTAGDVVITITGNGIRITAATVESCRSYCEAMGWTGGLVINQNQNFADNIGLILDCFRGDIIASGDSYKMIYKDLNYESVAMTLTDTDIVRRDGKAAIRIKPRSTAFRLPNAIEAVHFSEDLNYQKHTYLYADSAAVAADGDMRKTTINLLGLNDLPSLQSMLHYKLERARWGNVLTLEGRHSLAMLEPNDVIQLTHSLPNYTDQYLRVNSIGLSDSGTAAISAEEESLALYDDVYNPSELVRHVPPVIDLLDPPPSVINVVISEETDSTRLRTFTRLLVDFDPPEDYPYFDYAKIWLRKTDSGEWKYITKAETDWEYPLVQEGERYYVKLQSVNVAGVKEDFDSAYTVDLQVTGRLNNVPDDVTGMTAIATGDSVSIRANNPGYDDVAGWEVRLGAAWQGGIFLTLLNDPSYGIVGVRPGTHTFWMAIKSNAGVYSANPASASCRVMIPGWLTSAHTWSWDFTTGTHDNTEHDTYGGADVLKCSHTDGVLVGTWTSPSYDMGSLKSVRVWGDFLTTFIATTSTWEGVAPDPTTWADIYADAKTWAQIFQPTAAAQLKASLEFSENGSDWLSFAGMELLFAEVYARYLRKVIEITDPTADANLYLYELNMNAYTGMS